MIKQELIKEHIRKADFIFGTALTIGNELYDLNSSIELLNRVWQTGIRTYDTSNNYANGLAEKFLGVFLSEKKRDEFTIFTKVGWPGNEYPLTRGLSDHSIRSSLEQSLTRLSLSFIDVYFAHRFDNDVPLLDIIISFNKLIMEEKILSWGISEWPLNITLEALELCKLHNLIPPLCEQFVFSYLVDDNETSGKRKVLQDLGIITIGYSPLAQGLLTGKYMNTIPFSSRINKASLIGYKKTQEMLNLKHEKISKYSLDCQRLNLNPVLTALCWVKSKDVIPIIGLSNVSQISNITNFNFNFCTSINWNNFND